MLLTFLWSSGSGGFYGFVGASPKGNGDWYFPLDFKREALRSEQILIPNLQMLQTGTALPQAKARQP